MSYANRVINLICGKRRVFFVASLKNFASIAGHVVVGTISRFRIERTHIAN